MLSYFKTRANQEPLQLSNDELKKVYKSTSMASLYGVGFWIRLLCGPHGFGVVKKPMLDAGIVDKTELGLMGSAFFTYAIGKFSNGVLSDYAHIGRFMSFALLCSGLTCSLIRIYE